MSEYRPELGDFTQRVIRVDSGYLEYRYGPAGTVEIVNIEVSPDSRRKGIGTRMLETLKGIALIRTAQPEIAIYAFTKWDNTAAMKWYRKNGFQLTHIKGFYGRGYDAYLCVLNVNDAIST